MQAIQTKFFGPSNVRGARIKASAAAGSMTIGYDHALNVEQNHIAAANALRNKFGWESDSHGDLVTGQLADGTYVHTFTKAFKALRGMREWIREGRNNGNPWGHKEVRDAFTVLAQQMGLNDWSDV